MTRGPRSPSRAPETLGVEGLAFLARDSGRLSRFLDDTGVDAAAIREIAHEPAFLGAVLDHLLGNEQLLLTFCQEASLAPRDVWVGRHALGGFSSAHS